jgi:redox-sensing transcriptional repressor
MKKGKVSNAVIRRLPRYYGQLTSLYQVGVVRISSSALGKAMNLTASQIRQDLSCFGEFGQQGYGYNVESLRDEIAEILGMNLGHTAIILGAGNLGRALIQNFQFSQNGFRLTAAFDTDPEIIGTRIAGVPVLAIDALGDYLAQNPTDVGVLTVPQSVALTTANQLIAGGVKGLWNFTNIDLTIREPNIVVENVHFADSLLALSYLITPRATEEEEE